MLYVTADPLFNPTLVGGWDFGVNGGDTMALSVVTVDLLVVLCVLFFSSLSTYFPSHFGEHIVSLYLFAVRRCYYFGTLLLFC